MKPRVRLTVVLAFGLSSLYGQTCAPSRLLPAASVSGVLDGGSCVLSDGSYDIEDCGDTGARLEPTPSQPVTYARCESKNHRLVLARR